ncbi:hypothetical protein PP641_gp028 [Arthrobacter phage SilentRX]|uniref:Uncharacterized protein n=1 Tax=Arthrobacter phage SilentRX TaxID=2836091 RepID=A0A8F3EBJ6_9CAUD|nr:hypothetical protein PP641_gp028 [Arthrobacter phage SilentRX]QWY82769.1 hypothetical protein SEA_SILENTRX_28 [Arthrobacter phage SilentRX]
MPAPVILNIHEEAVQSYIREGGEVNNLLNDVAKEVKRLSIIYLNAGAGGSRGGGPHVRSGRLRGGLHWNRAKLEGPLQGVSRAISSAKHSLYFIEGTGDISHPNMVVPKNRKAPHTNLRYSGAGAEQLAKWAGRSDKQKARGKGVTRKNHVRGQWAKPFLQEGLAASLASQRLK